MTLSWYGLSSFKISSVGDKVTLISDPFSKDSGLTPPRGAADIVVISKDTEDYNNVDGITGNPLVIRNPGEFDVKGVHIIGVGDESGITIYHIEMDGIKIGFLGALNTRELTEAQIDALGNIDVLLVPVGGKEKVCNWEWASHIVQQVEPRFVVPMFYAQSGLKDTLETPDKFLKELGGQAREEDKLTLKPKDLAVETTQVITLKSQR